MFCEIEEDISDLISGVNYLSELFDLMCWDADHERIYGINRMYNEETCLEYARIYENAEELCSLFLEHKINIGKLVDELKKLGLAEYSECLEKYLPFPNRDEDHHETEV